jgi:predicted nuclease of predicted toxin-antitoxin system
MRILIDECVDPRIKLLLTGHETATVHEKGWSALEDGPLLTAAQHEFDVLLTIDRKMEFQQNLSKFRIGMVVAHVLKNQVAHYRAIQTNYPRVSKVRPGEVVHTTTARVSHAALSST